MTFDDLCRMEPKLQELLETARAADDKSGRYFCAFSTWHKRGFKNRITELVGWHAVEALEVLQTKEAFEMARKAIRESLPPCRGGGCDCE